MLPEEKLIEKLYKTQNLSDEEFYEIITENKYDEYIFKYAKEVRENIYGKDVYIRGLIEITNYCKNNCLYCGIRCENSKPLRYRLTPEDILECCHTGYDLGFRTFVLQGGEDLYFTDELTCKIITEIKRLYPDTAVTLSLGEKSYESYKKYKDAGADRYLLRHETASSSHYEKLHPKNMKLETRKKCLYDLKELGYQVGSGFMVGSPHQTTQDIIADLRFLQELGPHMVGIGPFISHSETPFASFPNGSVELTVKLVGILRLMFPRILLPATTALGTLNSDGREMALLAGANVVMPNLSPKSVRKLYEIYENKLSTNEEAAESLALLKEKVEKIGYKVVTDIGHSKV